MTSAAPADGAYQVAVPRQTRLAASEWQNYDCRPKASLSGANMPFRKVVLMYHAIEIADHPAVLGSHPVPMARFRTQLLDA